MENRLWYSAPAANWNEALPIGNGQLGAMVFGGADMDRLSLNHDTLWSGVPCNKTPDLLFEYFKQSVDEAIKGNYPVSQKILEKYICTQFTEGYMPMGDLFITQAETGDNTDYSRTLNFDDATCVVEFKKGGNKTIRSSFVSAPDNALVIKLDYSKPIESVAFNLSSLLKGESREKDGMLIFVGECPYHVEPNYVNSDNPVIYREDKHGIGFCFGITVISNGEKTILSDKIEVKQATEILVILTASTSFVDYKTDPFDPTEKYISDCVKRLSELEHNSYGTLYQRHITDYQGFEQRCKLNLYNSDEFSKIPTDERLKGLKDKSEDLGLYELLFRFGRYLLISSSRPGTQAANLQGIWNSSLRAPWSSNYTLNINTQMNYWPVFMTNLTECSLPLMDLVKDLSKTGEVAAKNLYDAKGYTCHHNTDLWRAANPVGDHEEGCAVYGFWPMSAAWLCRTVYEYYEFTGDESFLRDTALPLMRGATEFIISMLIPDENGQLVLCPATSPENPFSIDGKNCSVSKSTAMTQAIAIDLLGNCHKACVLSGDNAFANTIEKILEQIKPVCVGSDGRIMEWHEEQTETDIHHRHISHLYALHPAQLITPAKTPELAEACKRSLEVRGDAGTGWSLAWKINQWARLCDGERALLLIRQQLNFVDSEINLNMYGGGTYGNMFCAHPPFQIDGNFGATAGIAEMLVQSDSEEIQLLPALPNSWQKGSITGVLARGGYSVSVEWENGKLLSAEVVANRKSECKIRYGQLVKTFSFEKGKPVNITF